MKTGYKKLPPTAAFLLIGIAFLVTGISGDSSFVAIGCAFMVIGIAAIARHRRKPRGATTDEATKER